MQMSPVSMSFLSILEDIFQTILDSILVPVLEKVFYFVWDLVGGIIMAFLSGLFYSLFVILLKILLILEKIFDVFAGMVGVFVEDPATGQMVATSSASNMAVDNNTLLDVLLRSDVIVRAFFGMTAGAFVVCFLVTIFAVIRSMGESIGELRRPVSHVLRQTARACFTFAVIPIACIFMVKTAGVTIATVRKYMPTKIDGSVALEKQRLVSDALSNNTGAPQRRSKQARMEKAIAASRLATKNSETMVCDMIFYLAVKDHLKNPSNANYYLSGQHFQNETVSKSDINISEIEWIYALFEALLMILLMMIEIVQAITRIFMILILFVVSPYFVAMMPLDDGAKFKRWKDMFVGFSIACFGPVLAMRIYLVILPYVVLGTDIDFGMGDITLRVFRFFFILAGAYAVYKSQGMMLDIINPEIGQLLNQSSAIVTTAASQGGSATYKFLEKQVKKLGSGGSDKNGDGGEKGGDDSGGGGDEGGSGGGDGK